jgi:ADP-ribose pyrophosphatase YjhB (NUDIX family)
MKNFQITSVEDGKKYWISRSVAVSVFIFIRDGHNVYILANKRGKGTPDYQGYWNCPCGYLDWDENAKQAACREVFEETGVKITPSMISLHEVITNPNENNQNVVLRFSGMIKKSQLKFDTPSGGEKDEVEEVKLIPYNEVGNYKWAFNHDNIISSIYLDEYY